MEPKLEQAGTVFSKPLEWRMYDRFKRIIDFLIILVKKVY